MRVVQSVDDGREAARLRGIGDISDFMSGMAKGAEQVDLALVGARQLATVAHAHHLRATGFGLTRLAWKIGELLRLPGIRHVEDLRAGVVLLLAGEWFEHRVRDPPVALFVDERLIGAAALQVMGADQLHVAPLCRLRSLRRQAGVQQDAQRRKTQRHETEAHIPHVALPLPCVK